MGLSFLILSLFSKIFPLTHAYDYDWITAIIVLYITMCSLRGTSIREGVGVPVIQTSSVDSLTIKALENNLCFHLKYFIFAV